MLNKSYLGRYCVKYTIKIRKVKEIGAILVYIILFSPQMNIYQKGMALRLFNTLNRVFHILNRVFHTDYVNLCKYVLYKCQFS